MIEAEQREQRRPKSILRLIFEIVRSKSSLKLLRMLKGVALYDEVVGNPELSTLHIVLYFPPEAYIDVENVIAELGAKFNINLYRDRYDRLVLAIWRSENG